MYSGAGADGKVTLAVSRDSNRTRLVQFRSRVFVRLAHVVQFITKNMKSHRAHQVHSLAVPIIKHFPKETGAKLAWSLNLRRTREANEVMKKGLMMKETYFICHIKKEV
jgi:hypothetical protein